MERMAQYCWPKKWILERRWPLNGKLVRNLDFERAHSINLFNLSECRMKKKYYSWEEAMNLREVKVSFILLLERKNFNPNNYTTELSRIKLKGGPQNGIQE